MDKKIKISIIIPTHKTNSSISHAIDSCLAQNIDHNTYEILVIYASEQNAFKKDITHKYQIHPNIFFIHSQKSGANSLRNLGLQHARGEWLYFLDHDCNLPHKHFLSTFLSLVDQYPQVDAFGGYYKNKKSIHKNYATSLYNLICNVWLDFYQVNRSGKLKTLRLLGGNFFLHTRSREKKFLFDESILYGGAESELEQRLLNHGFKFLLNESLSVCHCPEIRFQDLWKKASLQRRNDRKIFQAQRVLSISEIAYNLMRLLKIYNWRLIFVIPYIMWGRISIYSNLHNR